MLADPMETITAVTSTAVAVVALLLAFSAERRNQRRFQQQLDQTQQIADANQRVADANLRTAEANQRVAEANIRPFLALDISAYEDDKSIQLCNYGTGTAVVKNLIFRRGRRKAASIPDLVELPHEVDWNDFLEVGDAILYITNDKPLMLIRLTDEHLVDQGLASESAAILEALEHQLDEVRIYATYEDVLGNVIAADRQVR